MLSKPEIDSAIPALRRDDGTWARSPVEKAEELASTFRKKWSLPEFEEINEYSVLASNIEPVSGFLPLRVRQAIKTLKALKEKSATGTDDLGTIILRRCAKELGLPFCKLCRLIIRFGFWPTSWCHHRICALYKKKSKFKAANYRGLQLTCQISKAAERFIGRLFLPHLASVNAFG